MLFIRSRHEPEEGAMDLMSRFPLRFMAIFAGTFLLTFSLLPPSL